MAGGSNNRYPSRRLRGIMVNGIFMERHFSNWMFYRDRAPPQRHLPSLPLFVCIVRVNRPSLSLSLFLTLCVYVFLLSRELPYHLSFSSLFFHLTTRYLGSPHRLSFFARPLKAIHTLFSLRLSPRPSLFHYPGETSTDGVCTQPNAAWHADTLNHVLDG